MHPGSRRGAEAAALSAIACTSSRLAVTTARLASVSTASTGRPASAFDAFWDASTHERAVTTPRTVTTATIPTHSNLADARVFDHLPTSMQPPRTLFVCADFKGAPRGSDHTSERGYSPIR